MDTNQPMVPLDARQLQVRDSAWRKLTAGTYPTRTSRCVCGEQLARPMTHWDRFGLPAPTSRCKRCDTVRLSAPLVPAAALAYLRGEHRILADIGAEAGWRAEVVRGMEQLELVARLGRRRKLRRLFQVGCGQGGALLPFLNAGLEVAGCDLVGDDGNDNTIGADYGLELIDGGATELLQQHGQADLVLVNNLTQLGADLSSGLKALSELVHPGGLLLFSIDGLECVPTRFGDSLQRLVDLSQAYYLTAHGFEQALRGAGLEPLQVTSKITAIVGRPSSARPRAARPAHSTASQVADRLADQQVRNLSEPAQVRAQVGAQVEAQISAPGLVEGLNTFFCIGCQKTGTTLLARMIDQHPDAACLWESYVMTPALKESLINLGGNSWRQHGFAEATVSRWKTQWEALATDPLLSAVRHATGRDLAQEQAFAQIMPEALTDFASRCGARVVGDKWPGYIDYLDVLMRVFPEAKLIYSVRDPRSVWNSAQRFRRGGRGEIVLREMLAKDRQLAAKVPREQLLTIRFEDLVSAPEATCARIHTFLGLHPTLQSYDRDRDPYPDRWSWIPQATSKPDTYHLNKWQEQMSSAAIDRVSRQSAGFIRAHGYPTNLGLTSPPKSPMV